MQAIRQSEMGRSLALLCMLGPAVFQKCCKSIQCLWIWPLRQWFYEGRKPIALQHGLRLAVIGAGSIGYFSFGQLATQDGFNEVWQLLHLGLLKVVKLRTFA